jgi:hypothetical protein
MTNLEDTQQIKDTALNSIRKKIISEVKTRIKKEVKNFSTLQGGEQEQIQDKYIAIISEKYGLTLSEFYATDGKFLLKILK